MHYRPNDLKLIPLKDVPAGSIVELVGRPDIPIALRVADIGDKPRIMLLGGEYGFQVAEWSAADALAKIVCKSDDLQFKLNDSNAQASCNDAGMLTLHNGGAFITAKPSQHAFHGVQIALDSWQDTDRNVRHGELVNYPQWEVGRLDHRGEFNAIFQRK